MLLANDFDLKGPKSSVHYGIDLNGHPALQLNGQPIEKVSLEKTSLGEWVSATTEHIPDSSTKKISVLIPPVHVEDGEKPVATIAIASTHKTSKGGTDAVEGQLIGYEVEYLEGSAQHVHTAA